MDLIKNMDVKDITIANYIVSFNLAKKHFLNYEMSQTEIIEKMRLILHELKRGTFMNILNILLVLKKASKQDYELLKKFRTEITQISVQEMSDKNKKLILMSKQESLKDNIIKYTDDLFFKKEYKKFIINKLILSFSTRNKDLLLTVKNNTENIEKDQNYLIIKGGIIRYIKSNYKTVKKYGPKIYTFTNDALYESCTKFLDGLDNKRLLHSKDTDISGEIASCTYKKIGTGAYFKLFVTDCCSINEIAKLSQDRGTSFQTINNYYNLQKN